MSSIVYIPAPSTGGDGYAQPQDSDGNDLGAPTTIPSGSTVDIPISDSTANLKDSAGGAISTTLILAEGSSNITAPDGTVQPKNQGGANLGSTFTVKSGESKNATIPIPLKFVLSTGSTSSVLFTVTTDEAGTYTTYTNDGSSGTWTYSKNGGSFTSLTGTIVLATSDTIQVSRTVITAQGYSRWAP